MDKKVWYLTGVSKGLGLALINRLLREGHRVAAVSGPGLASGAIPAWPDHEAVAENFVGPASPRPELRQGFVPRLPLLVPFGSSGTFVPFGYIGRSRVLSPHPSFLPLEADLADDQSVADSIRKTCEVFGRIDVVVNNAGYGLGEPIAHTITVIQKVMPRLRAQRSGHIINIAPITGLPLRSVSAKQGMAASTPLGDAFYAAARQAVLDLSATLADDVRPLGIRVTAVLSDGFHTRPSVGRALVGVPGMAGAPGRLGMHGTLGALGMAGTPRAWYFSVDGRLPGDPGRAADALLRIATAAEPPALAYLTSNAYRKAAEKMTLFGQVIASRQCVTSV